MSLKEKLLKIPNFILKMYFMLFNFIVDGDTSKSTRFMTHGWTTLIFGFLFAYTRALFLHVTGIEPVSNSIKVFVIGLLFPVIFALWLKYVVNRLLARRTFKSPQSSDEKTSEKVSYTRPVKSDEKATVRFYERKD